MAGRKDRWERNFKMYQDIRNNITFKKKKRKRKHGESTLRSCSDFLLQQIINSKKNYSFSLHSRIKLHVTLYNNPEQFLN